MRGAVDEDREHGSGRPPVEPAQDGRASDERRAARRLGLWLALVVLAMLALPVVYRLAHRS
jgi:hypothetical protein